MNIEETWSYIVECGIASEETLNIITCINGYNIETLNDVIYAQTAYRSIEQLIECEG